jgi:hypothetical protein
VVVLVEAGELRARLNRASSLFPTRSRASGIVWRGAQTGNGGHEDRSDGHCSARKTIAS